MNKLKDDDIFHKCNLEVLFGKEVLVYSILWCAVYNLMRLMFCCYESSTPMVIA